MRINSMYLSRIYHLTSLRGVFREKEKSGDELYSGQLSEVMHCKITELLCGSRKGM